MKLRLIATTIMGLEAVLKRECQALGFENIQVFDTKVEFDGDLSTICKANLWLRTAGRVYIKMAHFEATSFDELFEHTSAIDWADWIGKNDQFPISQITAKQSVLFSKSDCQAIVKKAIVKCLQKKYKQQFLPETAALFPIRVQIEKDWVTLSMDTSGSGLNKRGYRSLKDKAPLRETLAAGLVYLSRYRGDKDVLWDPFCGSGTILIEAALIAENRAPGLKRSFNSEGWACFQNTIWSMQRAAAEAQRNTEAYGEIVGTDISQKAIELATHNAELAGIKTPRFRCGAFNQLKPQSGQEKLICNPPYGERLQDIAAAEALYREMGDVFLKCFSTWDYYVLTASESFESLFQQKASQKRKLYNGGLKCCYYQFFKR